MARKLVWGLVLVPLALVLVAMALANRHGARLVFDPFRPDTPAAALDLPFFVFLFAALVAGVLIGGTAAWVGQRKWRRAARRRAREADEARREADRLSRQVEAMSRPQLPGQAAG